MILVHLVLQTKQKNVLYITNVMLVSESDLKVFFLI